MKEKEEPEVPFEKAFHRLEEILEKMNKGETSLEDSLRLFEEADRLLIGCNQRLQEAEKKVQILMKNRAGELVLDANGKPVVSDFQTPSR